jgi:hypothetical protein
VFAETNDYSGNCVELSGGSYTDMVATEIAAQDVNFADGTYAGNLPGVTLTYQNGAACVYSSASTKLHINIFCDANTQFDYNPIADTTNPCEPVVTIISQYGCSVMSISKLWEYIAAYEAYFGIFFLIGGFLLCFFGHKLLGPTVCMVGLLTSVIITCLIFYAVYATSTTDPSEFWMWLGGGVVVGIILGIVLMKY